MKATARGMILMTVLALSGCASGPAEEVGRYPGDTDFSDGQLRAITACQEAVEKRLKAPSTADFRIDEMTVSPNNAPAENGMDAYWGTVRAPDGSYGVQGVVDAENGFGAQLRQDYGCNVGFDGETANVQVLHIR